MAQRKKTAEQLAREYDVENYFDVIVDSYYNGHRKQAQQQFLHMNIASRKEFMLYLVEMTSSSYDESAASYYRAILQLCIIA